MEAALQHPRSFFAEPKDIVAHPTLSRDMKLTILREWELDARRLSASEGEGFCGGEESMLGRVEDAITLVRTTRLSAELNQRRLYGPQLMPGGLSDEAPLHPHQD